MADFSRQQKKKEPKVNVGSVSLVTVFCVLCLTIFCVLAVITANMEKRLTDKSVQAVANYYFADLACSEMTVAARELAGKGFSAQQLITEAEKLGMKGTLAGDVVYLSFYSQIDHFQQLQVTLCVSGRTVDIVNWQVVDVGEWHPDGKLNVWDGS